MEAFQHPFQAELDTQMPLLSTLLPPFRYSVARRTQKINTKFNWIGVKFLRFRQF